jgi:hypothetical protein
VHSISNLPTSGKSVIYVTGTKLASMLRKASATRRAVIDHDLCTGRLVVVGLTATQAQPITKVSRGYRCTAAGLDPLQLAAMRYGWATVSQYHNKKPTDAAIARFIKGVGADRVFAVLDEITKPPAGMVVDTVIATAIAAE